MVRWGKRSLGRSPPTPEAALGKERKINMIEPHVTISIQDFERMRGAQKAVEEIRALLRPFVWKHLTAHGPMGVVEGEQELFWDEKTTNPIQTIKEIMRVKL